MTRSNGLPREQSILGIPSHWLEYLWIFSPKYIKLLPHIITSFIYSVKVKNYLQKYVRNRLIRVWYQESESTTDCNHNNTLELPSIYLSRSFLPIDILHVIYIRFFLLLILKKLTNLNSTFLRLCLELCVGYEGLHKAFVQLALQIFCSHHWTIRNFVLRASWTAQ